MQNLIKSCLAKFNEISITKSVGLFVIVDSFTRYFNYKTMNNYQMLHLFIILCVAVCVDVMNSYRFSSEKITKYIMLFLIGESIYRYWHEKNVTQNQLATVSFILFVSVLVDIDYKYPQNVDNVFFRNVSELIFSGFWFFVFVAVLILVLNIDIKSWNDAVAENLKKCAKEQSYRVY
jgi:hypothetical protein